MKSLIVYIITLAVLACLLPAVSLAAAEDSAAAAPSAATPATEPTQPATPARIANTPVLAKPRPRGPWAGDAPKFFQGAFTAFVGHESGHLMVNSAFNTDPTLEPVHYGPVPFFTIEPGRYLTRHEHYITASAGFNAQNIIDEWLLTAHPNLSQENDPYLKGLASFNFWLTVGYAATAFAGTGPDQRDTKGMADALGWNERWVGVMILVPAALDTYRYKHPDSKWAKTASRLSKLAIIGLAANAHD